MGDKEEIEMNLEQALRSIYEQIFTVDLQTDTYYELYAKQAYETGKRVNNGAQQAFWMIAERVSVETYKNTVREFLDFSTIQKRMEKKDGISTEFLDLNGTWHSLSLIVQLRGEKGEIQKFLFAIRDINEEKKRELDIQEELRAARDEANAANKAKSAFLINMSHDIRTPMNAIMGFTDIALKCDPKPEIKNCLEKVKQSSDHLMSFINDVLDISRIESGNLRYTPMPVNLSTVTDEVLNMTKGLMLNRDLQLVVRRGEPMKCYVLADEVRIREILINIMSNAIKFTKDGGSITFETSRKPGIDSEHIVFCYRVADTGIGMSKEFVEHIFEEFSQENTGARTQYQGTGLGMAITKQYVELMGGTIEVESEKGKGTTVTVDLPLELSEPIQKEELTEHFHRKDTKDLHVLMAEDNDLNAEIAAMLLEDKGMHVTRAVDGREAVELFENQPAGTFDVVLMDIMMPRMNGYEATRSIRHMENRPDGETIPILAMTANAFAEDVQAAMDAGMNAHLAKPIVIDTVTKAILESLDAEEE